MAKAGRGTKGKRRTTKDRVLQARIPETLDEELRDRADHLGLSVSTLVRNVLFHTFNLVEGVVTDSAQLARNLQEQGAYGAESMNANDPVGDAAVIGWQEAILNWNGVCHHCNTILAKGERAVIGIPVQATPILLCLECLAALSPADDSA